jgi:hypothetical protein
MPDGDVNLRFCVVGWQKASLPHVHSRSGKARRSLQPLILSFSRRTRLGEFATQDDRIRKRMRLGGKGRRCSGHALLPLPAAFARECGHFRKQARQGELARERAGVRGEECKRANFWLEGQSFSC